MSIQDQGTGDRQRAWALLAEVGDHPKIQEWLQQADTPGSAAHHGAAGWHAKARRSVMTRRFFWSAAATVVLTIAAISAAAYFYLGAQYYETKIGEQRDVLLADGSGITLNTNTAVAVRYSRDARRVELVRGEAIFTVKHDAARAFEVTAGETLTRAVGTEFNVDLRNGKVTVSVLEGAVRVSELTDTGNKAENRNDSGSGALAPVTVAKDAALEFRRLGHELRAQTADLKRIDAWRARRLEFSDTPLRDAVEEFNRYSTTHITVSTSELESVRVSGVFHTGDVSGFLYSLREALGVQIHESAGAVVLTRPAHGSQDNTQSPD